VARTTRVSASMRMVFRRCAVVIFSTIASSTWKERGKGRREMTGLKTRRPGRAERRGAGGACVPARRI
jgi:hypothetical protein